MQTQLLNYLRCPLCKSTLELQVISYFEKPYHNQSIKEVKDALLFSPTGFVFPVIDGIPRMLVEAIFDYREFMQLNLKGYKEKLKTLENDYSGVIKYCKQKNAKTKKSFAFEWSFLNTQKGDKIWQESNLNMKNVFLDEVGKNEEFFKDKVVADIGCGHGVMTTKIAEISNLSIGVELGLAVEEAYARNKVANAYYVQADLQFLPFEQGSFDVLYSSGVIHHTNNTELSFSLIEEILKTNGMLCLWLYHPQKSIIHNLSIFFRKILCKLPISVAFAFICVFIFPLSFIIKKIKGNKNLNVREDIINLLDAFTPEFREEIPHDLATLWLSKRKYTDIKITTQNQFGFSIVGLKN